MVAVNAQWHTHTLQPTIHLRDFSAICRNYPNANGMARSSFYFSMAAKSRKTKRKFIWNIVTKNPAKKSPLIHCNRCTRPANIATSFERTRIKRFYFHSLLLSFLAGNLFRDVSHGLALTMCGFPAATFAENIRMSVTAKGRDKFTDKISAENKMEQLKIDMVRSVSSVCCCRRRQQQR